MPTYMYKCDNCGMQFEKFQKFSDKALKRCPECNKGAVRRVIEPSAIVFKGSGWYATDHRSASGQNSKKKDEGAGEKTEKKDKKAEKVEKAEKKETSAHP